MILFLNFVSCKTDDTDPESFMGRVQVFCFLADYDDPDTTLIELWVGYKVINRYFIKVDSIGHCWNFDTDTLPTIDSEAKSVPYSLNKWDLSMNGPMYTGLIPFRSGIPVNENNTKIIIRSFIMYNDSLIVYSTPLTVENPIQYAQ